MRIVINGTFDMVHMGHIRLLECARSYPQSFVYVLIDSDRRVRELKGTNRPINSQYERSTLLSSLRMVDRVDIFDTDQELEDYIKLFQPDLMIKGSDYRGKPVVGSQYCPRIYYYDRIEPYSTTKKIEHIVNR